MPLKNSPDCWFKDDPNQYRAIKETKIKPGHEGKIVKEYFINPGGNDQITGTSFICWWCTWDDKNAIKNTVQENIKGYNKFYLTSIKFEFISKFNRSHSWFFWHVWIQWNDLKYERFLKHLADNSKWAFNRSLIE